MKDTEQERQHERERAWNMPLSARSRTVSHTGTPGHSPRHALDHPRSGPNSASHSREHSRPSSPSESVSSRAAEEGDDNYKRERNWGSPHQKWDHRHRHSASPIPGPSPLRPRTQSTISNSPEPHAHPQAQSQRLRHTASHSSLHSESSSRASSPADPASRRQSGRKDEDGEDIYERERNWGSRQQKWTHTSVHKRVASPTPAMADSRVVQTQNTESALTRPPSGLLKRRPSDLSLPAPPEAPEHVEEDEMSRIPISTSSRLKSTNGHVQDKPSRLPSRLHRADSPANGPSADVKDSSPASAPARFGWQFPRNRPQLPDFEPESSSRERSPSPLHRPTSRIVGSGKPSHIPVRSPSQVPKVEIKRNGHARPFTKGHKRTTTEFTEANGAIPPNIYLQPDPELEFEPTSGPESTTAKSLPGLLSPSTHYDKRFLMVHLFRE